METKKLTLEQFTDIEQADGTYILLLKINKDKEAMEVLRISQFESENTAYKIEIMLPENGEMVKNTFYTDKDYCLIQDADINITDHVTLCRIEWHVKMKSDMQSFLRELFRNYLSPALKKIFAGNF